MVEEIKIGNWKIKAHENALEFVGPSGLTMAILQEFNAGDSGTQGQLLVFRVGAGWDGPFYPVPNSRKI